MSLVCSGILKSNESLPKKNKKKTNVSIKAILNIDKEVLGTTVLVISTKVTKNASIKEKTCM